VTLALAWATARPVAAGDAPTARPLEGEAPDASSPGGGDEPARTLPPSVAVCHDPGGSGCWTAPLAEDCAKNGGRVYRVVLGDAKGRDAMAALIQCRAAAQMDAPRDMGDRQVPERLPR